MKNKKRKEKTREFSFVSGVPGWFAQTSPPLANIVWFRFGRRRTNVIASEQTSSRPNWNVQLRFGRSDLLSHARAGCFLSLGSARHHPLGEHRFGRWRAHTRRARHAVFTSNKKLCLMGKIKGGKLKNKKDN